LTLSAFRAYICAMKTKNSSSLEDGRIKVPMRFAMAMGRAKTHLVRVNQEVRKLSLDSAEAIGKALGFKDRYAGAIHKIYRRNQDESQELSVHVNLTCTDGKRSTHRLFNAQAAVKFGLFCKTTRAKASWHWGSKFLTKGVKQLPHAHPGEEWFTTEDIGKALGFMGDEAKAIRKIYERNADEFEGLSSCVKMTLEGQLRTHRLFNAQAAVKIGFFAKTIRAKAFRHWASQFLTNGVRQLPHTHRGEEWFTAKDIGRALGFKEERGKAINKIFSRNQDEFEGLSVVVKVTATDGKRYTHRLFNAQAAVKFGFFAKTIRAKAFRHWASEFLTKGVKQLRAQHEKAERRIRRLERKNAEWETCLEVMKGDSHQVSHALMCEIAQLEKQLHQGVSASLLRPEDVVALPWAALKRLADLAGDKDENYPTRLLHAVLACQGKYDRAREFIKANLGTVTISFDMRHLVQGIEEQAEHLKG